MSAFLYIICGGTLALAVLLTWLLSAPRQSHRRGWRLEEGTRSHIQYFPQIQQAMSRIDNEFLLARHAPELARAVRRERREVVLGFLDSLGQEFDHLMRLARVIASLSPEVAAMQEFERLRLSVVFRYRAQLVRSKLLFGAAPVPELGVVSDLVSRLSVRMEEAMRSLGERAALASEMASALDRGDANWS